MCSGILADKLAPEGKRFCRLTRPTHLTIQPNPLRPCSAHRVPNRNSFASLVVHTLSGEVASLFGQDPAAPERRKNGNEDELAGKRNSEKYLLRILVMREKTHTHIHTRSYKKQKKQLTDQQDWTVWTDCMEYRQSGSGDPYVPVYVSQ